MYIVSAPGLLSQLRPAPAKAQGFVVKAQGPRFARKKMSRRRAEN